MVLWCIFIFIPLPPPKTKKKKTKKKKNNIYSNDIQWAHGVEIDVKPTLMKYHNDATDSWVGG